MFFVSIFKVLDVIVIIYQSDQSSQYPIDNNFAKKQDPLKTSLSLMKPMKKYKYLQKVGEGSFGKVTKAIDEQGNLFAIKEIPNCNYFEKEKVEEEINIMSQVQHPNLVKIYDSFYEADLCVMFIVMEFCDYDLLKFFVEKDKTLTQDQVLFIFKQIVSAFRALNQKGIIHRDLKPQNILVTKNGEIKVADFGCAKKIDSESMSRILMSFDKGTASFAAPQILKTLPYSSKCDIWSAGCLVYFLLTKRHPFLEKNIQKTMALIQRETLHKEIQIPNEQNVCPELRYIIKRCLMYSEVERCTWRQFYLCRMFADKIGKVKSYLDYLKHLSNIANWISQTFWKERKKYAIAESRDEIFMYFIIKFQYSVLELGMKIINRDPKYSYLFDRRAWETAEFDVKYVEEYREHLRKIEGFYQNVKSVIKSLSALLVINEKKTEYFQCFADLQNSMKAAQKILNNVNCAYLEDRILQVMGYWVNFEKYFDYSHKPSLDKLTNGKIGTMVVETFNANSSLVSRSN